jgi:hypothetical protein
MEYGKREEVKIKTTKNVEKFSSMTMISLTLIQLFVLSIICQFQSSHIYHEIMNSKDGKKYFKFKVQFSSVETASVLANDDDSVKLPVRGFSDHFQYEHKDKIHNFE